MAAKQFFLPFPVAFTSNGLPAAGAKLYFYETGTLTPEDTFTDSGLTTEHAHPVVANGAGRFATIYLDDTIDYRLIIKDSAGNTLDDIDPFIAGTAATQGPPGDDADNPNFTAATGAAGTNVVLSGTYPNLTLTIPRGDTGASGAGTGDLIAANNLSDVANAATSRTNLGLAIGTNVQAFDADLATIAANITAAGHAILDDANAAAQRTTLGLGSVDNTADTAKPVSTAQQTALDLKKNLAPNEQTVASSATVTPTFSNDLVTITAQAAGLTLANPTGTAVNGWGIAIRIKDNGSGQTIAYGAQYRAVGVTLPTTTVASKTLYLGMIYNSAATKWDVVSVAQEA